MSGQQARAEDYARKAIRAAAARRKEEGGVQRPRFKRARDPSWQGSATLAVTCAGQRPAGEVTIKVSRDGAAWWNAPPKVTAVLAAAAVDAIEAALAAEPTLADLSACVSSAARVDECVRVHVVVSVADVPRLRALVALVERALGSVLASEDRDPFAHRVRKQKEEAS